mmetsp:Transcript_34924/g.109734  ORF Transcript_34924/g.109734 Transcript_34924/m.109734 type:complete len:244 (+) Transcript_34924:903-1634(+)
MGRGRSDHDPLRRGLGAQGHEEEVRVAPDDHVPRCALAFDRRVRSLVTQHRKQDLVLALPHAARVAHRRAGAAAPAGSGLCQPGAAAEAEALGAVCHESVGQPVHERQAWSQQVCAHAPSLGGSAPAPPFATASMPTPTSVLLPGALLAPPPLLRHLGSGCWAVERQQERAERLGAGQELVEAGGDGREEPRLGRTRPEAWKDLVEDGVHVDVDMLGLNRCPGGERVRKGVPQPAGETWNAHQ